MNTAVGPNFKVIFAEFRICESCKQCTGLTHTHTQKKKTKRTEIDFSAIQTYTMFLKKKNVCLYNTDFLNIIFLISSII